MGAQSRAPQGLANVDVLIVGAGLSGLAMGYYLAVEHPGREFAVVDGRDAIGGTWDLFRYPGIRSDSDMQTFGYAFKPWTGDNAIADAHEILSYLNEMIDENTLRDRIHLGIKVIRAAFSSVEQKWTVTLERTGNGERFEVRCNVFFSAAGYYDHAGGYAPAFEGEEDFGGQIIHPQQWPEDLDYTGKKVVVIGSGATAVTIVPAMTDRAAHVTMLQRSPSYVLPVPRQDALANALQRTLSESLAYRISRRISVVRQRAVFIGCQKYPKLARKVLRRVTESALPKGYPVDTHFNPAYNPWDQRLCTVPDGDLFAAISAEKASVVTDKITRFTTEGILLESGAHLEADVVVTATGLRMLPFGGIELSVDDEPVDLPEHVAFRGMMLSDIPNFAFILGYSNLSWTMKLDMVCTHLCRILSHMDRHGFTSFVPVADDPALVRKPLFEMQSGYLQRGVHAFPTRGGHGPWQLNQHLGEDRSVLIDGPLEDPALKFATRDRSPAAQVPA